MRIIVVEDGHKCPLCPDHWDEPEHFVWSDLLRAAICHPCTYEIHNGFLGFAEWPPPNQYSAATKMKRIRKLTGLTFQQAKFIYLRSWLRDNNQMISETLRTFSPLRAAVADLHAVNIRLDAQISDMCLRAVDFRFAWHDDPAIFSALIRVMPGQANSTIDISNTRARRR
jgi:hypothetical protein